MKQAWMAVALIVALAISSFLFMDQRLRQERGRVEAELSAITRLKVDQLAAWRAERLADAAVLSINQPLTAALLEWMAGSSATSPPAQVTAYLEGFRQHYRYQGYLLVDAGGRVRLNSLGRHDAPLDAEARAALAEAWRTRQAAVADLHTGENGEFAPPHLGFIAPLLKDDAPMGAILLMVDARQSLFPLIQSWPKPSASAEILMVRRDADEVLILNELRDRPGAALTLRLPLSPGDLPTAQATQGQPGLIEGPDYRGVPVVLVVLPVPNSPWWLIGKVDRAEILAEGQRHVLLLGGWSILALALLMALAALAFQRRALRQEQALHAAEAAKGVSLAQFRHLFDQSQDGIVMLTEDYRIVDANPAALRLLGYDRDTLQRLHWPDVLEEREHARLAGIKPVTQGEIVDHEEWLHRRQDGSSFLAEVTVKALDAHRSFATLRDISQRRTTEEQLRMLQFGIDRATDAFYWTRADGHFVYVNEAACRSLGVRREALLELTVPEVDAGYDAAGWQAFWRELRARQSMTLETTHRSRDGRRFPVEVNANLFVFNGEEYNCGIVRDISERKRAESALWESETQFRALADTSPLAIYLSVGEEQQAEYINQTFVRLFGYAREELPTVAAWWPLAYPEASYRQTVMAEWQAKTERTLATQAAFEPMETRVTCKDGAQRFILWGFQPIGEQQYAWGLDLTELRRAEQEIRALNAQLEARVAERTAALSARTAELAQAAERLRLAMTATRDGLWDWHIPTGQIYVNDPYYGKTGTERVDLSGNVDSQWLELLHPEDRAGLLTKIGEALQSLERFELEFRLRGKDDGYRWMLCRGRVVERDASGAPLRAIGTHFDISERKAAEAQIRHGREKLQLAIEGARLGDWHWNVPTDALEFSDFCLALFGLPAGTPLTYERFRETVHPDDRAGIDHAVRRALEDRTDYNREYRVIWPDGSVRWIAAMGRFSYDAQGAPRWMEGICTDSTERKQAEQVIHDLNANLERRVAERTAQLAAASAAKTQFLAHMSHEIRTPMNAILGLTQLLEQDKLTQDQHAMLHKISESGESLIHIINDILDFSKIEAGQLRMEPQSFELTPVLKRVEQLLRLSAAQRGLTLRIAPPLASLGMLLGDPLRLEQILINLINNGIKFTEQGGVALTITELVSEPTVARLRFEVQDTGIGIAPEALAGLFQPFTQADASITRRFGGTGLGLVISKRLVELMGGQLGATSNPGQGSCFWFELPFEKAREAAPDTAPATAAAATQAPHFPGLRLLAVDDNRINLFLLERVLQREGAVVTLAADGQQALQILKAQPQGFDAVLMDIQMPVMDGLTATREIRRDPELAALPVIALTAGVLAEERAAALDAGVNDFLAKPLDLKQMNAVLAQYATCGR